MIILVWDTETTGLTIHPAVGVERQPRMIEFGGALINTITQQVELTASILINPGVPISQEITGITGITNDDVKDSGRFIDVANQIKALFKETDIMMAHNLGFDERILRYELARHCIADWPWPKRSMCTAQAYAEDFGRNPRLIELYEHVTRKQYKQTHRALDDVLALTEIVLQDRVWEAFEPCASN